MAAISLSKSGEHGPLVFRCKSHPYPSQRDGHQWSKRSFFFPYKYWSKTGPDTEGSSQIERESKWPEIRWKTAALSRKGEAKEQQKLQIKHLENGNQDVSFRAGMFVPTARHSNP